MPPEVPARSASRYAGHYAQCADPHRLLEIFTDSHTIALTSKNPDTARGRFDLAVELYHQLVSLHVPPSLRSSLQDAMVALTTRFPSQVCINEATGLREKARKLRTARRTLEFLNRAREVLQAGLTKTLNGPSGIQSMYDEVLSEIAQTEALMVKRS